jgi:hypothetical protein
MSKFKKLRQLKIGNYFRELSVVIIGVAVTLYASNAITGAKEREGMNIQLNAIYAELDFNLSIFDGLITYYDDLDSLRKYVQKDYANPGQGYADSLSKYIHVVGQTFTSLVYKKGAYEMFLNSGSARLFEDKALLSGITECYTLLGMTSEGIDKDISLKMDMIRKLYDYDTKAILEDIDLKRPMYRSLYNYYLVTSGGGGGKNLKITKESIEKALAKQ